MSIEQINKGDNLSQSENIVETNIDKLKALFPEIVTEGKIDFKVLQEVLGNELEEGEEYYRFTWAGKANARREAQKPSTGTLRPAPEESVDWDTTQNLYIEGDNLEVLKLLQKSYAGKVKMIYIDPPYNTGKDILYKNDFSDSLKSYLDYTNQTKNDQLLSTNPDTQGRYHSDWLTLMYSRIRLSRNLLTDNGFIVLTIDHFELHNLIKICDEIFGEDNRIVNVTIQHNPKGRNQAEFFSENIEYMLIYSKNKSNAAFNKVAISEDVLSTFSERDNLGKYRWESYIRARTSWSRKNRPNNWYPIYVSENGEHISSSSFPNAIKTLPENRNGEFSWKNIKDTFEELNSKKMIRVQTKDGEITIQHKYYEQEVLKNLWIEKKYQSEFYGTNIIKELFGSNVFSYPKSIHAVKDILKIISSKDDLILDFFSGSATTAHATIQLNLEDSGNRKYVMVQLPEYTDEKSEAFKSGFKTIDEIGKERIRRAAKKIVEENPEKAKNLDLGFKVFKLDTSNIKGWDGNPDTLDESLFDAQDNIKTDRTEHDVLYEILLKYGLDLTLPIEEKNIEGKTVFSVGFGALFICLADNITNKVAEGIGKWKEELQPEICRVVFKDSGFTDVEKTNSVQTLKRFGITEIKSI
ncbi:Type III restriction-modification system methylation subunit [Winogradskyella psychrotolerans RS-3]|uniref:site-specific DNA-methyltransferase (adenine-specific) n=1 Tax=Winogradskyella psychrotolerans RS-3 TaxID=641526 RepID=S7VTN1_9FLAO|nr:site-specific DNA-methyltransferase [Winogradskyella psychrotolerans]EPR73436.1 Type III restriction-modification system methylation subunit [Winogradskyella psychrotolerans RS-3]